jgi:hypothetical protein
MHDESRFIELWAAGLTTDAIAEALGIPPGTARSRAYSFQRQGKIIPRPRGGARQRRDDLPTSTPVQKPVHTTNTGAVQCVDTGAVQILNADVAQLKSELAGLRLIVQSLVDRLEHPPVQTPVQITTLPPYPPGKAVRWILDAIRDELARLAQERDMSPSQLVQEVLWKSITERPEG